MPLTELDQILIDVKEIDTHLLRLSVVMRGPVSHDKNHVRSKFPMAKNFLCDRIGRANSRRRQFFKHKQLRSGKLAQGLRDELEETETEASSLPSLLKDQVQSRSKGKQKAISVAARSESSQASSNDNDSRLRCPCYPTITSMGRHSSVVYAIR